MRDPEIRAALTGLIMQNLREPDTLLLEEFGLCQHAARVDIAVVNGILHGYEIKSTVDKLDRLQNQQIIYNRIFDRVTIVADETHVSRIMDETPTWWGVIKARVWGKRIRFKVLREPNDNKMIDPAAIVQLLWRDEAIALAKVCGLDRGILTKPRSVVWKVLANSIPISELSRHIRLAIKRRFSSEASCRQESNGGLFLRHANLKGARGVQSD
jgi:hypothetical protein